MGEAQNFIDCQVFQIMNPSDSDHSLTLLFVPSVGLNFLYFGAEIKELHYLCLFDQRHVQYLSLAGHK